MKKLFVTFSLISATFAAAADFDARAAFGSAPGRDLDAALKRAQKDHTRVLVFTWNPKGDYNDQGLRIKYMTDLEESKELLKEKFTVVLLDRTHKDIASHLSGENSEQPMFVLFNESGSVSKKDKVYANPTEGLRIFKELAASN